MPAVARATHPQAVLPVLATPVRAAKVVNVKATLRPTAAVLRAPGQNMYVRRATRRVPLHQAPIAAALPAAATIEATAQAALITEATRPVAATIAAVHLQEAPRLAQVADQAAATAAGAVAQALAAATAQVQAAIVLEEAAALAVVAEEDKFQPNPNN